MPTGGKADKIPPQLLSSFPENQTKNFTGKEINMVFDELIDANSIYTELMIIPDAKNNFEYKVKNNTIKIKFDKPFQDSTTYTLNFRNAIKDLSERNPAKNLKLVFSTGDKIDSLNLNGTISNINTKYPEENITVGIYPKDTLSIYNKKPLYFVESDSMGTYLIENIKANDYFVMAFNDKNNNLRYDQDEEELAFLSDSIRLNKNITLPDMAIYKADRTPYKVKRNISRDDKFSLQLNKDINKMQINFEDSASNNSLTYTNTVNEIFFYKMTENVIDTIKVNIILTDSLLTNDTLQQKIYFKEDRNKKSKIKVLPLSSNIKNNENLTSNIQYIFNSETPIVRFTTDSISFKTDTLMTESPKIELVNPFRFEISINTKAKKEVELYIPSNAIEDFAGDTNNVILLKNNILQKEELGNFSGYTDDITTDKIALLIQDGKIIESIKFIKDFRFADIIPGNYFIEVILDTNQNGIWDPGNLNSLTQPEQKLVSKEAIRIRANFDITQKIE